MNMSLVNDGIFITILGMGTVFFFLVVLILAMQITEKVLKFIGKFFPEEIPEVKTTKKKVETKEDDIAVAIACALRQRGKV